MSSEEKASENQEQPIRFDDIVDEVCEQVPRSTPIATVEAIARQIQIAREARARIEEEGIVVRDMRGSVIAHPAIKIESDAQKLFTTLLKSCRA